MENEYQNKIISKAIEYIQKNKTQNNGIDTALINELKSIKTKYRKQKYLAFDAINDIHEPFDSVKDARSYLQEAITSENGYHPDTETCSIYLQVEVVKLNIPSKKEDFTPEAWREMYNEQLDGVCEHKFIKV